MIAVNGGLGGGPWSCQVPWLLAMARPSTPSQSALVILAGAPLVPSISTSPTRSRAPVPFVVAPRSIGPGGHEDRGDAGRWSRPMRSAGPGLVAAAHQPTAPSTGWERRSSSGLPMASMFRYIIVVGFTYVFSASEDRGEASTGNPPAWRMARFHVPSTRLLEVSVARLQVPTTY